MQIDVNIPNATYPVVIEPDAIQQLEQRVATFGASSVFALIDSNVANLHSERLASYLPKGCIRITIPAGEKSKSIGLLASLYDEVLNSRDVDRSSLILAIGGGVVGDLAGFLAATLLRGIRFIQIPTTLLAMVDSSIGGKTGINHSSGKNLIGAFHQPAAVLADLDFLTTLPQREYNSGFAEVIKSAVIGEPKLFNFLQSNSAELLKLNNSMLQRILFDSVGFKAQIVAEDEHESARRAILNYGHTVGHILETSFPGKYLHGEAVSIGIVSANRLAVARGVLRLSDAESIANLLNAFKLPTQLPELSNKELIDGIRSDKKRKAAQAKFVLAKAIGQSTIQSFNIDDALAELLIGTGNE